ncbi:MAG: hypothetical protein AAGI11_04395 [Pseudomonadota bacterium]
MYAPDNLSDPAAMQDEEKRHLEQLAQSKYPGRGWDQLSAEEQAAVFKSYEGQRAQANALLETPVPQGRHVGPDNIYVGPNWGEQLAYATRQFMGHRLASKANKAEALGRQALVDVQTRRDHLDKADAKKSAREEEERRRAWLSSVLAGGAR